MRPRSTCTVRRRVGHPRRRPLQRTVARFEASQMDIELSRFVGPL